MDTFIQIGEKFGLEGEKLRKFVEKQQKLEQEREEKKSTIGRGKRRKR